LIRIGVRCVPFWSDREETPRFGDALELMFAAVLELESGTGHEIFDRARDQHFAGSGERRDAGADRDRDASDLAV
jgi:hypothetical protein